MIALLLSLHALPQAPAAGSPPARVELVFAPAPGARVSRGFEGRHALAVVSLRSASGSVSGLAQSRFELSTVNTLDVLDRIDAAPAGAPAALRRVYERARLWAEIDLYDARGERTRDHWEARSPLEGHGVVFTRVPGKPEYGRHYVERETLEEYLGGLAEDLDLRALLPGRAVAPGDEWEIPAGSLSDVFAPGGRVTLGYAVGGGGPIGRLLASGVGGSLAEVFGDRARGGAKARLVEVLEEGEARLARVAIEAELETSRDLQGLARSALGIGELFEGVSVESARVEWSFEGRGELLWNLDAGRFEKFDLAGGERVSYDLAQTGRDGKRIQEGVTLGGSLELHARASAP